MEQSVPEEASSLIIIKIRSQVNLLQVFNHSSSFHFPAMDKMIWGVRRIVADKIVEIQMDLEHLSRVDDDLPPAMLSLWEKMEKALSLLKNSLGISLQNLPYPHLCVPNSTLLEYRQLEGRKGLSCP